ncbi:MAG: aldehyde dehydrogenase family protein [Desulfobacterales bacterium]|jgi:sulfoacetaldehyde dehydrogenase|nr:aldehyde dehydrogenase family protein [Desulfobacterales bacterium]
MPSNEEIIAALVAKARAAQKQVENYTQEQIDEVALSVAWQVYKDENIAVCARSAVDETGKGVYEDKLTKHKVKVFGVCRDIKHAKTVGVIERDEARGLTKYAKPVGVVGALTPVTNPTATPASNGTGILKGRNAVIFAPHPAARNSCRVVCEFMREGLRKVGAPVDLVQFIEEPSVALSQELMRQVDLVLATGGAAMVKSAYSSGTPSYGVGAGNPVIIVAEDAELADAAEKIRISKSFDNATSCSSDNSLLIQSGVFDPMVAELKKQGGHLCNPEEKDKLEKWMWAANPKTGEVGLNPKVVAISARRIAADAGIAVPDGTRFLMVVGERPGEERFSGEKISPVLALWRYGTIDEAIGLIEKLHTYAGMGHSVGIYSFNRDYIHKVALAAKVSRILVRQAHAPSAGGHFHNGMPSTVTLGCGTWGGNITTENIHWKHFINVTWVSEPLPVTKPTEDEIWGPVWAKYGK